MFHRTGKDWKNWQFKTDELLKDKLDKLMIRFSVTNPEFYDAYLRAGTIVD